MKQTACAPYQYVKPYGPKRPRILNIPPAALANSILITATESQVPLTPAKLQRLVYLAYAAYLKQTGGKLFSEEFQVWNRGPVILSLHWKFRCFGNKQIMSYAKDAAGNIITIDTKRSPVMRHILADIKDLYLRVPELNLSQLLTAPGTAWFEAVQNRQTILDDHDIKQDPCWKEA